MLSSRPHRLWISCCAFAAPLAICLVAQGQSPPPAEPLHVRIDKLVAATQVGPVGGVASDAEFLRRIYLDLAGTIPSSAEARAFIDDKNPAKRAALIDRLLAGPRFAPHMANVFDVMWMERRADKYVPAADWQKYLQASFAQNKPYDVLAREVLSADGSDPATRPQAKFLLEREAEPNLLTRDIGRMFFGRDLQCAQCHDHPLIDGYLQREYYGIYAFVVRTSLFTAPDKKVMLAENAEGEASYQSVFDPAAKGSIRPVVPGGAQLEDPIFNRGEQYTVAPAPNVRPVPKYSRRAQLAAQATSGTNRAFNRNIANRLWAHMFGRGLVHPVDFSHPDNPPSNSELLDALTAEIVALKFDMKAFLREIALSQTYQRAFDTPALTPEVVQAAAQQAAALEAAAAPQKAIVEASQQAVSKARSELDAADKAIVPITDELAKASPPVDAAKKAFDTAFAALNATKAQLAVKQDVATTLAEATAKAQEAAKKLPAEKDLAAAAEKFAARSTAVTAEVAALTKNIEPQTAAIKTAGDALAAAQQAVAPIVARVQEGRTKSEAVRQQYLAASLKLEGDVALAKLAEHRLASAKAVANQVALAAAIAPSRAAAEKGQADLAAGRQALEKLTAEVTKKQADAAVAQKASEDAAKQLAESQQAVAAKQDAIKTFAEVLAKAEAAKAKLPGDAELAATAAALKTRGDQLTAEAAEAQKVVVAREPVAKAAAEKLTAATQATAAATAEATAQQQRMPALEAAAKQAADKAQADAAALGPAQEALVDKLNLRLAVSNLRPLSPEQIGWSIMQASGVFDQQRPGAEAEIAKTTPLTDAIKNDPAQLAARNFQIEQLVVEKLKGNVGVFVGLFGGGAGQPQTDFYATVDQALFFANGGTVRGWLAPSGGSLAERAIKLEDPKALAEEVYLGILTRRPTDAEAADVQKYLAARPTEKPAVVQELLWALVTSTEFRFNH